MSLAPTPTTTTLELTGEECLQAPGLGELVSLLWREGGRGVLRPGWRPFTGHGAAALALRDGRQLLGMAVARPAVGMDNLDFVYARPGPDRARHLDLLLGWAERFLAEHGLTKIVYAAYSYWRQPAFPADVAAAFRARGYGSVTAVFLEHPLDPLPAISAAPAGYQVEPFDDARTSEAARMMLECPEPEAIYWDYGLCCRSIAGAAALGSPSFPDGLGQQALDATGRLVAFSLATTAGYVNHVYTRAEHRGRGLAQALVTRVLAAIKARGARRATILTHETNPGAIRCYQRLGFRTEYTYPQFFLRREGAPPRGPVAG